MTGDLIDEMAERVQALLTVLAGPKALLRDDQLAAIRALVIDRRRAVVVKRTGWGKSAVYFLASGCSATPGRGRPCWFRRCCR